MPQVGEGVNSMGVEGGDTDRILQEHKCSGMR